MSVWSNVGTAILVITLDWAGTSPSFELTAYSPLKYGRTHVYV